MCFVPCNHLVGAKLDVGLGARGMHSYSGKGHRWGLSAFFPAGGGGRDPLRSGKLVVSNLARGDVYFPNIPPTCPRFENS